MIHRVQKRAKGAATSEANAQRENAHMFHARIGKKPFVICLPYKENGGHCHR
jgi:hypothetical protein